MIESPNSTLIGKGFGCLVIKCEGDNEMEVGEEGAREERWGATEGAKKGTKVGRKEEGERRKKREELLEKKRKAREARELLEV